MFSTRKMFIKILFCSLLGVLLLKNANGQDARENSPILIISSYNPETSQTSSNISEFLDEYKLLGGVSPVIIENMNCKSFSESLRWEGQMHSILEKYQGSKAPNMIMLLGQEAWTSYLSQNDVLQRDIPILCGMVSRNAVLLPDEEVDLEDWEPESTDLKEVFGGKIQISGFVYDYDITENVNLIKRLFPKTQHIAFISDNSYGGVSMQAWVKNEMKKFPDLDLILLDGRKHTIYTIVDQIAMLPENTAILVGTWRVDKNEGYFMRNATYSMMSANPHVPAFSLASLGLGHWVVGGYIPQYRSIGKDLAHRALNIQKKKQKTSDLEVIPNGYTFDNKQLIAFDIDEKILPSKALILNKELTFFEKYRYQIWGVSIAFGLLLIGFVMTFYYFLRTKRLKDELLVSEVELVAAKERAEESDRLKSAFLANMSHEIRTPLNAIVGFSNVLVTGECAPDEQKEFVDVIQTNSDLLLRLINDILDISRLETGKLKFSYEECEVVSLGQRIMATTSYSKKEEVEYVYRPFTDSFVIETDVQRLQQILINLLSNANKFTLKGQIILGIEQDADGESLIFSVTDTGCGIPLEKQQKVFERFEKLDEYVQGTGLGLAICKITVGILGGEIWIDQDYTDGARFMFSHPIRRKKSLNESR